MVTLVRDDYEFRSGQRFLCYLWLRSWNSVPSWRRLELRPWYPGALLPMIIRSLASPSVYSFLSLWILNFRSCTPTHAHITPSSSTSPLIFRGCAFSDLVSLTISQIESTRLWLRPWYSDQRRHLWGAGGRRPPPPQINRKKKKKKKKKEKKKKEKEKRKKREKRRELWIASNYYI